MSNNIGNYLLILLTPWIHKLIKTWSSYKEFFILTHYFFKRPIFVPKYHFLKISKVNMVENPERVMMLSCFSDHLILNSVWTVAKSNIEFKPLHKTKSQVYNIQVHQVLIWTLEYTEGSCMWSYQIFIYPVWSKGLGIIKVCYNTILLGQR